MGLSHTLGILSKPLSLENLFPEMYTTNKNTSSNFSYVRYFKQCCRDFQKQFFVVQRLKNNTKVGRRNWDIFFRYQNRCGVKICYLGHFNEGKELF